MSNVWSCHIVALISFFSFAQGSTSSDHYQLLLMNQTNKKKTALSPGIYRHTQEELKTITSKAKKRIAQITNKTCALLKISQKDLDTMHHILAIVDLFVAEEISYRQAHQLLTELSPLQLIAIKPHSAFHTVLRIGKHPHEKAEIEDIKNCIGVLKEKIEEEALPEFMKSGGRTVNKDCLNACALSNAYENLFYAEELSIAQTKDLLGQIPISKQEADECDTICPHYLINSSQSNLLC